MSDIPLDYKEKWDHFVNYAKSNGFMHYIGNLSFFSYKTGNIVKLIGEGKVNIIKKFDVQDAEFNMIKGD